MSNTPLPEPAYYQWRRKKMPWSLEFAFSHMCVETTDDSEVRTLHTADQMHAYAAAVSAADNATLLETQHKFGQVQHDLLTQIDALRERVEVLEDALNQIASWREGRIVDSWFDEPVAAEIARAALGDSVPTTQPPSPSPRS